MRTLALFFFTGIYVISAFCVRAQTVDFEDALIPKEWVGNVENFKISNLNKLQLNAPVGTKQSSLSWLNMVSPVCSWSFNVQYDFNASASNYAAFYLYSTQRDFSNENNVSYFLKIGGIAGKKDQIELYYQNGTTVLKVLQSRSGIVGSANVHCRIQITKDAQGFWELSTDSSGGYNYISEASAQHWEQNNFLYSGLRCIYSSTRRDKFYWDDIQIQKPFSFLKYRFKSDSVLEFHFNEPILATQDMNIFLDKEIGFKTNIKDSIITFVFCCTIPANTYKFSISNMISINGAEILQRVITIVKETQFHVGQIRISEFMSDPSPSFGLPEIEWIEIFNSSNQIVNLNEITISDPKTKAILPTYFLEPKSAVLICASSGCAQFKIKNCIETATFPNLNNDSDSLFMWYKDTILIDFIEYTLASFKKDYKSEGGYSIMRKTFPENCVMAQQLMFSEEMVGGSPGIVSDFKKSNQAVFKASVVKNDIILIEANGHFTFDEKDIQGLSTLVTMNVSKSKFSTNYLLHFSEALEPGYLYSLKIDSILNCKNERFEKGLNLEVIFPQKLYSKAVYINEVLYNPSSGGIDFIELHNTTDKYMQLNGTHLQNESVGLNRYSFSENIILNPYEYIAITSDTSILIKQYPNTNKNNVFQATGFLSLPDTGGEILLMDSSRTKIDGIRYGDMYQNSILRNTEGYSLEKIEAEQPFFDASNWTSSSTGATPGYKNSQFLDKDIPTSKNFYCAPCHVSTNLNGVNDFLILHLNTTNQGDFGTVSIFDLKGEKISDLSVNQLLGTINSFQWNGVKQSGEILADGIYVAVANWWSVDGKVYSAKIAISTSQY